MDLPGFGPRTARTAGSAASGDYDCARNETGDPGFENAAAGNFRQAHMAVQDEASGANSPNPFSARDDIDPAALERVMAEVPRGALALAGIAVLLLLIGWFGLYILVFLPRGSVG